MEGLGRMEGRKDRRIDRRIDSRIEGWKDGREDTSCLACRKIMTLLLRSFLTASACISGMVPLSGFGHVLCRSFKFSF